MSVDARSAQEQYRCDTDAGAVQVCKEDCSKSSREFLSHDIDGGFCASSLTLLSMLQLSFSFIESMSKD